MKTQTPPFLPVFGEVEPSRLLAVDELFAVVSDKFPISPGHALIIPRRAVARFRDLTSTEKARLLVWIDWTQEHLAGSFSPAPEAFNLGVNDGPAAGQTIPQFHFHVIPRYMGDVEDPRGGIRYVIPSKARYWEEKTVPGAEFFTRFDSPAALPNARTWTGNDQTNRHHHGSVGLNETPLDLVLSWKTSRSAKSRLVGCYRLNLPALLKAGFIRAEKARRVRLRFVHAPDGQVYIQCQGDNAPRLLVGTCA